ncbi:MAG: hypothetical protein ACHQTF_04950 [Gemmatimonadales bacterium]|jgi:hypothetical protein
MPAVPFGSLPASARVWIFAADHPLTGDPAAQLLAHVDEYLAHWQAHGHPLTCAREWRHDRFLAIAVDQTDAFASGCSIDGLFRALQSLQKSLGTTLVGGARVHYRDAGGAIQAVTRDQFSALGATGGIDDHTPVFDSTVATAGEWRERFETELGRAWHKELVRSS